MERRIRRGIGYLTLMTQIGAIMVVSVSLGIYLGRLIDLYLGTQILFTMILLVAGAAGGIVSVYRLVQGLVKQD
ncbi:MAG: AtpZ/AtpI family protein [Limnochordia bacterium]|jgi:F0F1-type ATP synthase assembly protein I|nr:AtpZ/AtpI family protein [Bacillota bacterium]